MIMRKKTITFPDGKKVEVEISEIDIPLDEGMTVEDYRKKREEEKKFDVELDRLADDIISKVPRTEMGGRTIVYWEIGRLVSQFIRRAPISVAIQKEPYEAQERAYTRLIEKMNERLNKNRDFSANGFSIPSVPYLKKWERFARKFTKQQAERDIPYSLAHELIDDKLKPEDIDMFLEKCERGELKTTPEVRDAVDKFLKERGRKISRSDFFKENS
jgi:hypothetical protein